MPASSAMASSRSVLPPPEKTLSAGATPAARARTNSLALKHFDDGKVRVGLQCISEPRPLDLRQGVREHGRVTFERRSRINVNRRPDRFGDLGQRNVLAPELAIAEFEMIHV